MPHSKHFIPRENPYLNKVLTVLAGISMLCFIVAFERGILFKDASSPGSTQYSDHLTIEPVKSTFSERRKTDPTYPLPGFIAEQMPSGDSQDIKQGLMAQASDAVRQSDRLRLGNTLALLGAAELNDNDLDGARVYLDEALSVYEEEYDALGIGSVELLRSRVETVARENARDAAGAYEVMQIAAWMISKGRFFETEYPVRTAIEENLRLERFGSAAAGYEMLERGYRSIGNALSANEAAAEAIKLHAASGRIETANKVLQRLELNAASYDELEQLKSSIKQLGLGFQRSILNIGHSKDFERLYRNLISAGDPVQAWTFRQKANQSLAQVSSRAMHYRQTGIVALLYNSNRNKEAASKSLERAKTLFIEESRDDLLEYVNSAEGDIW